MMLCSIEILVIFCFCFSIGAAKELSDGKACVTAQNFFTEKNIEFERCTMQHAVTDNFCLKCITHFVEQNQAYQTLLITPDTSNGNTNQFCGNEVTKEDHFGILKTHFIRSKDVWNTARCTKCFNCDPENIPLNSNITAKCTMKITAIQLQDSASNTKSCFHNSIEKNVCKDCALQFDALMAKYRIEKTINGDGGLCFDVKDAIDQIHHMWHKQYKCGSTTSSGWSFTTFFLLIAALGAISYGSFRSYRVYRFRRDYLSTAMENNDNASNSRMLEQLRNDSEL